MKFAHPVIKTILIGLACVYGVFAIWETIWYKGQQLLYSKAALVNLFLPKVKCFYDGAGNKEKVNKIAFEIESKIYHHPSIIMQIPDGGIPRYNITEVHQYLWDVEKDTISELNKSQSSLLEYDTPSSDGKVGNYLSRNSCENIFGLSVDFEKDGRTYAHSKGFPIRLSSQQFQNEVLVLNDDKNGLRGMFELNRLNLHNPADYYGNFSEER